MMPERELTIINKLGLHARALEQGGPVVVAPAVLHGAAVHGDADLDGGVARPLGRPQAKPLA